MIRHRFDLSSMAYGTHKQARLGARGPSPARKARVQVPPRMRRSHLSATVVTDMPRDA